MNKVYIIGMGTGDESLLTFKAVQKIEQCDVIIGGKRHIETFKNKEKIEIKNNLSEIVKYINENKDNKKIAILASGDAFMYGIGSYIVKNVKDIDFENISGISSIQYMAGKCGIPWQDIYIGSVHGRNENFCGIVSNNKKTALLTATNTSDVIKEFYEKGFDDLYIYIGENLSYEDEKITEGTLSDLIEKQFSELSVMIIINNSKKIYDYISAGIPDEMFERGKVPMTKEEVRAVSISKLKLKNNSIVFDIGSGTGSVTVECGLNSKFGMVYGFEKNTEAVELTKLNLKKFGVHNSYVFEGDALTNIKNTDIIPTRVFIGGTGGDMYEILDVLYKKCENLKVVINCIAIESVYEAIKGLEISGYKNIECVSVSVSRNKKAGSKNMMIAQNNVYIISGEKGDISER